MARRNDSEKGAALVLVLGIIAVMSSMAVFLREPITADCIERREPANHNLTIMP